MTLLTLFSTKAKCTSFRLNTITLSSNKDPQNVAYRLKDASKLFKVHFMFKLKVELEVSSVCNITNNCSQKYGNTAISKISKFPSLTILGEKSFSILFCLPLNISRLIIFQLKMGVSIFHTQAGIIQAGHELLQTA